MSIVQTARGHSASEAGTTARAISTSIFTCVWCATGSDLSFLFCCIVLILIAEMSMVLPISGLSPAAI